MLATAVAVALIAAAAPAGAQCSADLTCQFLGCRTPAFGVPSELWGVLQPTDTGQLPLLRDNTNFSEFFSVPGPNEPHWVSLDAENGWIFAAINYGLQVWDARGGAAASPVRTNLAGPSAFAYWNPVTNHEANPIRDVDAPDGDDSVVAVAGVIGNGINIFDATDKTDLAGLYADRDKNALAVYAAEIGGTAYAFTATSTHGLLVHDMTAAGSLMMPCIDNTPALDSCGVYVGSIGARTQTAYVDGAGDFLAVSSPSPQRGIEIWDVGNPASPVLELDALGGEIVYGVALWQQGASYYLATRVAVTGGTQARIYDLSCLPTGCGSIGPPIHVASLPSGGSEFFVTHSESGGRQYVYHGNFNRCAQGPQNEWLYDVTDPAAAFDLTPPDGLVDGQPTGYWGWYYRRNPTGFNRLAGRVGKVHGDHFYRAAYTIFDIHRLNVDPSAIFSDGFESGNVSAWDEVVP